MADFNNEDGTGAVGSADLIMFLTVYNQNHNINYGQNYQGLNLPPN